MRVNSGLVRIAIAAAGLALAGGLTACTTDPNDPGAMSGSGGTNGGAGAIGTMTGVGGAGGAAPAGTACASPITIAAASPGIADFDTYDGVTAIGSWSFPLGGADAASGVYAGPFGYGDRASGFPETFEMTAGQNSKYALRIADTLAQNYGGGLGTWLSACVNATSFAGISFWIRGNSPTGKVTLTLSMQETLPSTRAKPADAIGTCAGDSMTCVHPTFAVDVTDTWTKIQVPWAGFTPGTAPGASVTPNGRNIIQIQFGVGLNWAANGTGPVVPTPAPYELAVDTLAFY